MSSNSSIVDRLMARGFDQKGLQLNLMYVVFLVLALVLVGVLAYSTFNADQYGNLIIKFLFILGAVFAGVAGHLLQGPFAHFSVILFFTIYNFFVAHYQHFTTASSPTILAQMKTSAEVLFWTLAFFGILYLAFVYFPQINSLIPTADEAYRLMKRRPAMSAPKAAAAPAPSA
jgi:hypothetical protein